MAFPTSFSTASAFWRFTTWSSWSDFGNTNCNIPVVWLSKLPRGLMFTILAWFFDDAIGSVMVMIMVINDDQSWWSWFTMTVLRGYIVWSWTTTCYPIPICHQQTTWLPGELAAPPPPTGHHLQYPRPRTVERHRIYVQERLPPIGISTATICKPFSSTVPTGHPNLNPPKVSQCFITVLLFRAPQPFSIFLRGLA